MTLTLLGVAVGAGILSTFLPRTPVHWLLGLVSFGALIATLVKLPSGEGDYWLVLMATLIAVGVNAFGLLMLLAHRHPRRVHRHIIYCGYGLVFATIALLWALVIRYPGPRHDRLLPRATVRDLLRFGWSRYPGPMPIAEALAVSGLAKLATREVGKLGPAEFRRARLALALLPRAELLVLDEPTAGTGPDE